MDKASLSNEIEVSTPEEDAYLLNEMESVKDEPMATPQEMNDFRKWLKCTK
ncbi:hypothetical protein [Mucilaginibacter sp.]